MTYGSIRIAEASYDNLSAYSTVPVSVYISINESNLDLEKPQISYSISNKNWTNNDVSINVTASDNLGISKIILPDDTEVYNDSVVYTVSCNGDYTFKAVDVSGNVEVIIVSIKNIDKTAPSITVNYDSSVAVNALPLLVIAEDDLSGIDYIKVNNNYINNNEIFVVTENGPYLFEIKDLAGNLSSVIVEITLIKDESNDNTSAPPDVDINNEIPTSPKDENEDSNIIKDDIEDSNCNNDVNNDIKNNDAIIAIINTGNREHVMTYPKSDTYILESIEEEAVLSVANESQSDDKNFIDKTYENNNQNKNQSNTIAEKEKSRSFIPIKTIFILVIASSLVIIYVFIKNRRV